MVKEASYKFTHNEVYWYLTIDIKFFFHTKQTTNQYRNSSAWYVGDCVIYRKTEVHVHQYTQRKCYAIREVLRSSRKRLHEDQDEDM